jgi:acyl-[acyl-carrier-protein]-phospholipid O-acyltransferase/long-chain-fatty-acid--[acyl-carrier-protein] ligase
VNLNYTLGNEALAEQADRARIRQVVTSRRFLRALERTSPVGEERTLYVEDLITGMGALDRALALAVSFLPARMLARIASPVRSARETATIIFSSGSTSSPKGIVLSHGNILSNVQGVSQVISLGEDDRMLGVLPFFHSFGYTVTLWAPLLSGATVVYHQDPRDARTIGALCARHGVTIMLATPTFYRSYLRRIAPEDLRALRLAVAGAEKLPERLAEDWLARFGVELLEGYGATELSPVVSVNVPDVELRGSRQRGHKRGSIGRALPGVAVQVVDPDTFEPRPTGEEGLLLVRGPGVMQGYLDDPARTAEAMRDGWYVTGDVAKLDDDGFLVITDRLSRFSKIGGEMVPHGRIEDALHEALDHAAPAGAGGEPVELAVTSLPDEQKGERLVVVHTLLPVGVDVLLAELAARDLPNLFLPKSANFVEVSAIPKLGSGKTDLRGVRELAAARLSC